MFTQLFADQARAEADAADLRRAADEPIGPLDGRIVSIKSLVDIAGEVTLAGSAARRTLYPALSDAPIVTRLRQAGAVIVGSTAMTELAFLAVGPNRDLPWPGNARDPERVPGGSSSGAGVAVAEGTCEIAIGSDTGGSVRIPAALNGIVGFKPSLGIVPTEGTMPLSPTLDTLGPLANSVADCAATFQVMAGLPVQAVDPADLSSRTLGVPRGELFSSTEPGVAESFRWCCDRLQEFGASISELEIDDLLAAMREATANGSIASLEAAALHRDWLTIHGDTIDPRVGKALKRRLAAPFSQLQQTLKRRDALAAQMAQRVASVDALLLPTVPIVAPRIDEVAREEDYSRIEGLLLRNTQIANQFNLCAISLSVAGAGLPVGVSLMAPHGADLALLALAQAVETVLRPAPV